MWCLCLLCLWHLKKTLKIRKDLKLMQHRYTLIAMILYLRWNARGMVLSEATASNYKGGRYHGNFVKHFDEQGVDMKNIFV